MNAEALYDPSPSRVDAETWLALGAGAVLLLVGASRRSTVGACLAIASAPLLYRGITGQWPDVLKGSAQPDSTRTALHGDPGVHVRESIRLEVPVGDVYRFWRRLENLPQFLTHLDRVTEGVDYLRNNRTNTSICAYSPRARPGAVVSMPITSEELRHEAGRWTLPIVQRLLRARISPWADYWNRPQQISLMSIRALKDLSNSPLLAGSSA